MLAVKILQNQNIEVDGVCFKSNFFGCEKARKAAEYLGIKLIEADISGDILNLVKNPPSGYGKHLNPCVDCHALMIKKAGEFLQKGSTVPQYRGNYGASDGGGDIVPLLRPPVNSGGQAKERTGEVKEKDYDFIATGEVLGQRPFSQNKDALRRIEKIAGVEILRPLSAKLLPETAMEKQGLVIRGRLQDIQGRTRDRQMELAENYNIKEYESPAGGCLLTDPEFSQRLLVMLDNWPECGVNDIELLKNGRVFWFKTPINTDLKQINTNCEPVLVVIGRNQNDNENLEKLAKQGDIVVELKEIAGPLAVVRSKKLEVRSKNPECSGLEIDVPEKLKMSELKLGEEKSFNEILRIAALLTGYYAVKARGKKARVLISKL